MHRYNDTKRTNSYEEYERIYDIPFINKMLVLTIILFVCLLCIMNAQQSIHNNIILDNTITSIDIQASSKKYDFKPLGYQKIFNYTLSEGMKKNILSFIKNREREINKSKEAKSSTKTKQEYTRYKAKEDDSFWSIAEKFYGNGKYYIHILLANHLDLENPQLVIGKKYNIPKKIDKKVSYDSYMKKYLSDAEKEYFGNFKITGYDIYCSHCCGGKSDGITSSGVPATVGKTVALNRKYNIPYGTTIYIEDYGYFTLEDTGLAEGYVDIACDCHEECFGLTSEGLKKVYIVKP